MTSVTSLMLDGQLLRMSLQRMANITQNAHDIIRGCVVTLANGDLIIAGGMVMIIKQQSASRRYKRNIVLQTTQNGGPSKKTYRYNAANDTWTQMVGMSTKRDDPSCGVVVNATSGKEEVVVTGGPNGTTEIYTVESNQWRYGTPMPFALWDAHLRTCPNLLYPTFTEITDL